MWPEDVRPRALELDHLLKYKASLEPVQRMRLRSTGLAQTQSAPFGVLKSDVLKLDITRQQV